MNKVLSGALLFQKLMGATDKDSVNLAVHTNDEGRPQTTTLYLQLEDGSIEELWVWTGFDKRYEAGDGSLKTVMDYIRRNP